MISMKQRQTNLWRPIALFIEDGGTEDELIAVYRSIKETRESGHDRFANVGRNVSATTAQTKADTAAKTCLSPKTGPTLPPVSLSARGRAKNHSAQSVFDRELTHTGRKWGNVAYCEYDSMTEDGDMTRALKAHIGQLSGADRLKLTRELMTPREFAQLRNKVRKNAA